jgi:general secretion pathway protein D
VNKIETNTNLVVQDGETIILGGLIREDTTNTIDGIPFLSKIPLIGSLFSTTTKNTTRAELILLLTPHVLRTQKEAKSVTEDYVRKYRDIARDRKIDEFLLERMQK